MIKKKSHLLFAQKVKKIPPLKTKCYHIMIGPPHFLFSLDLFTLQVILPIRHFTPCLFNNPLIKPPLLQIPRNLMWSG